MDDEQDIRCTFCDSSLHSVDNMLVSYVGGAICNKCIDLCNETLTKMFNDPQPSAAPVAKSTPSRIKQKLDQYVIGQDAAKKILSVAVYNHYKRVDQASDSVDVQKSNVLMIGPTGSGKTLLAKTLANIIDVPFAIADATSLTETGYVGEDVESVITRLLHNAGNDIERCQRGIIYIDEVDKIAKRVSGTNRIRDVSGEGVQQALLKLIEGTVCSVPVPGKRNPLGPQQTVDVDTSNILFICSGAFSGLNEIMQAKDDHSTIGFNANVEKQEALERQPTVEDFVSYGMIPEILGRLPIIAVLKELDTKSLIEILTKPKNAIVRQFQHLFEVDGIDLQFTPAALEQVANRAIENKTGARGLRTIIEDVLQQAMYEAPDNKDIKTVIVDETSVTENKLPLYLYRDATTQMQMEKCIQ